MPLERSLETEEAERESHSGWLGETMWRNEWV